MEASAIREMDELTANHFWFVGAREALGVMIEGLGSPADRRRILEIGCGPGGNLAFFGRFGETTGIDLSQEALRLAQCKGLRGLSAADCLQLPFAPATFDLVLLPSVIEHIEDDTAVLREAARVCRKHGHVILMTSALPMLWSHHDLANQHFRRYRKRDLLARIAAGGLEPCRVSFQNFVTFVPVLLVRGMQRWYERSPRYDMGRFPAGLNRILTRLLRWEAQGLRKIDYPIGVDLIAVCKPADLARTGGPGSRAAAG